MTIISIIVGIATFFNFSWYENSSNIWQIIIQVILVIISLVAFIGYRGPKYQKFMMWNFEKNTYWGIRRVIQGVVMIGSIGALIAMIIGAK